MKRATQEIPTVTIAALLFPTARKFLLNTILLILHVVPIVISLAITLTLKTENVLYVYFIADIDIIPKQVNVLYADTNARIITEVCTAQATVIQYVTNAVTSVKTIILTNLVINAAIANSNASTNTTVRARFALFATSNAHTNIIRQVNV